MTSNKIQARHQKRPFAQSRFPLKLNYNSRLEGRASWQIEDRELMAVTCGIAAQQFMRHLRVIPDIAEAIGSKFTEE